MNSIVKIVVAVLVAALIVVIGLIVISNNAGNEIPENNATAPAIQATATPEAIQQPEETMNPEATDEAASQAQNDDAQEVVYEGALAGMTEEEIAQQALAEEQSHGTETESND